MAKGSPSTARSAGYAPRPGVPRRKEQSMLPPVLNTRFVAVVSLVVSLFFLVLYFVDFHLLAWLTVEDGVVEDAEALFFLRGAILFALAGFRGTARKLWAIPLAVLSFLVAGEEISWGQRIFHIKEPSGLAHVNEQGELNLHNIEGLNEHIRAL